MTADTTIKVTHETRDRLAVLASEHKDSIGGFIADVAARIPTAAEIEAAAERTRATLAQLGVALEPEDRAAGEAIWAALDSGDNEALVRAADA
jgi:hypothetical protein